MHKDLLPYPKEIIKQSGNFLFNGKIKVVLSPNISKTDFILRRLNGIENILKNISEFEYITNSDFDAFLVCLTTSSAVYDTQIPVHKNAYSLEINKQGIYIAANDIDGLFYGLTTLIQMMDSSDFVNSLECCIIKDWPSIMIRGHFDDISRKRVSTTADFKLIVQELSRYKINYYGLYLEDMLHIKSFPDIGRLRGKLMNRDVHEIVEEAKLNRVEIIPFFQLLGHCENLLNMPNYKHLGKEVPQRISSLDPDNPEVRKFLSLCIEEVCSLFPCEYFGMGFDETQGLGMDAYIKHANWCAEKLVEYGKKPLIWADMFNGAFGFENISKLHHSIILVNWHYDCIGEIPYQKELEESKRDVWGFGGYSTWVKYIPDFEFVRNHMDTWSSYLSKKENSALFYSQWGDNGYENNRDLPWNLFLYGAETSWCGGNKYRDSFNDRFIKNMFGVMLPELKSLISGFELNIQSKEYWKIHRKNPFACMRLAFSDMKREDLFKQDFVKCEHKLDAIIKEHNDNKNRTTEHGLKIYNHFITNLIILKLNMKKMILVYKLLKIRDECEILTFCDEIRVAREAYIKDWLLNNRREGLEVSTRVFDEIAASFEELLSKNCYIREGFLPLNLDNEYDTCMLDIGGAPVHDTVLSGIPFRFAGVEKTHITLKERKTLAIPFNCNKIKDIYFIVSSPLQLGLEKKPLLKLQLLNGKDVVWEDKLNSTEHICDWFAPYGEHIWSGGGYSYVDKDRVIPACNPDVFYGLMITHKFRDLDIEADKLVIDLITHADVQIFAITVEISKQA